MRGLVALALAAISTFVLFGCERWELDRKMEELCKKDGGIKVYETVTLSASEFVTLWKYVITAKSLEDYYGPSYRYVSKKEVLLGKDARLDKGEGQLDRIYQAIYRRSDNRLLGEQVAYLRGGGDYFTFGFQPSSASCPRLDRDLAQKIFIQGK